MKRIERFSIYRLLTLIGGLLAMLPETVLASGSEWRPTYDLAMMWVNFIILAAIIVKYARDPIKTFLKQQKKEVVSEMDELESEKKRVIGEIKAAKEQARTTQARFEEMKERMIAQGEVRKQQIVSQARQQSAIMIEETRKKMATRILQAKNKLKIELADLAFEQASQQLPQIMTDKDSQLLMDNFMQGMHIEPDVTS